MKSLKDTQAELNELIRDLEWFYQEEILPRGVAQLTSAYNQNFNRYKGGAVIPIIKTQVPIGLTGT